MKKTLVLLSIALFSASVSIAQSEAIAGTKSSFGQERANAYAQALGLDVATAKQMAEIFDAASEEITPLNNERDAIQAKIDEVMAPYEEKALSVLTPEQHNKLAAMKKEGNWKPETGCAPKAAAAGCAGHAKPAGGAGCCAGRSKAQ